MKCLPGQRHRGTSLGFCGRLQVRGLKYPLTAPLEAPPPPTTNRQSQSTSGSNEPLLRQIKPAYIEFCSDRLKQPEALGVADIEL